MKYNQTMEKLNEVEEFSESPPLDDFCKYLPWACSQLALELTVIITKVFQNEYVSTTTTDRSKKGKSKAKMDQTKHDDSIVQEKESSQSASIQVKEDDVRMLAVFDNSNRLVEIKFEKNKCIPRALIKLLGLIVKFYQNLNKLIFDGGIDKYTIYEINKFIITSHITEIILDNSRLMEANYYILLDTESPLRHLSLCRCKLNDEVIQQISKRLACPSPASKTLLILNLCTNRITDIGAKYLSKALRCNQKLAYLNLADNLITDVGADYILSSLVEFELTEREVRNSKRRYMQYLLHKNTLIKQVINEMRLADLDKKTNKKKSIKPSPIIVVKKGKLERENSARTVFDSSVSCPNISPIHYDKVLAIVQNAIGEYNDPHSSINTITRDCVVYCLGNNTLLHLNLAYNNISYLSLRQLLDVLLEQKKLCRKPTGLVSVSIEGNNLPVSCKESASVERIMETGLMLLAGRTSFKKKVQTKIGK